MKLNTTDFINLAINIHGNRYDYSKVDYVNMKTKVIIICPIHGEFLQSPDKHIHGKCGCPYCANNVKLTKNSFIERAIRVHGDRYDYSLVNYVNNKTPVDIKCPVHSVFSQTPTNHLSGKGCPYCANNVCLTTDDFVKKAFSIHGDKYDYSKVDYVDNHTPVQIICAKHGVFSQIPYVHLAGSGCPLCGEEQRIIHRDVKSISEKTRNTCLLKYGVDNPMKSLEIRKKHLDRVNDSAVKYARDLTKRKNGSFNTSLPEYRMFCLLKSVFSENDVFHNYECIRYPFKCDFYIKSRDLFVELNAHWSHGGHWYTDADFDLVENWKLKSEFYKNAAETFSVRDVNKRKTACDNMLNYLVFWKNDLSDVKLWISKGCPDGRDWLKEYSWL